MQTLLNSKIALVGVSESPEKYGHKIFKDLLAANYDVIGINPKAKEILDQKIYPSLRSLNFKPDLVIIVVPPSIALVILREINELKIKNVWMQPGSESDEAIKFAQEAEINLVVNSCIMVEQGLW